MHIHFTFFLSAILVTGYPPSVSANSDSSSTCKAAPGSSSWPSHETWKSLNESSGGRLLQPAPPGAVCHPGQSTYNSAECPSVQSNWSTYNFHQSDPISSMWNQFNNDSCLPNPSYPCSGQGYPIYVINATTAEHVKLGVDFARKHNIRLIVKSSGHDYIGRSSGANSLSIWTHHIQGIKVHDSFRPSCCDVEIEGGAVTVGSGSQMWDMYRLLDQHNQTIVGGGGASVSVGGYLTGGGHSMLSSRHGLAADQILEMQVVTPKGEILTINECKNPDLFWAMRGGGGSTFGIMTSVTMKTYPTPKLLNNLFLIATPTTSPAAASAFDVVAYVLSQFPSLSDSGLSGYSFVLSKYPNPLDGGATYLAGMFGIMALQDTDDQADMQKLFDPIFAHVDATWPGFIHFATISSYPSFWGWYQNFYDQNYAGNNSYVCSRLLDEKALTADRNATRDAMRQFASEGGATAYLVGGKGVMNAQPRGGSNAVLPAWRKAYVHATCGVDFEPFNASSKAEAFVRMNHLLDPLRKLAPDSGAYMNEADPAEPDWEHQFWGTNYERLVSIKRSVDPDDVLWCNPCVGNERWHEVGDQLCRV